MKIDSYCNEQLTIWQDCRDYQSLFASICRQGERIGFPYCAYTLRLPYIEPASGKNQWIASNNYPRQWQLRYQTEHYADIDPCLHYALSTTNFVIWDEDMFRVVPEFRAASKFFGINYGISLACRNAQGLTGVFSLARKSLAITGIEYNDKELYLYWFANQAHILLSEKLQTEHLQSELSLSPREYSSLRALASGQGTKDFAATHQFSIASANSYLRRACLKLKCSNKISAAVKAAQLGLFD